MREEEEAGMYTPYLAYRSGEIPITCKRVIELTRFASYVPSFLSLTPEVLGEEVEEFLRVCFVPQSLHLIRGLMMI